jgi:hypothetical protein
MGKFSTKGGKYREAFPGEKFLVSIYYIIETQDESAT